MANINYNISASYIGTGYEAEATFQFYYDVCGDIDNLVASSSGANTFNSESLANGVELVIPETAQYLYLLPLSQLCPLGCDYLYKHTLSNYTPVTPTPTPTSTPAATPGNTPTPTPTVTPTPSGPELPRTYGNLTVNVISSANIKVTWDNSIPVYTRSQYASQLANYLAQTTVSSTTNVSNPNEVNLAFDFDIYNVDLATTAYDVNDNVNSRVWWYGGTYGDSGQEETQVNITNVSVGDVEGIGPSLEGILGFLEE